MFDNVFGIHERALMLHSERTSVLAANIANADTPGYKARDIDFSEVLAGAGSDTGSMSMATTDGAHLQVGATADESTPGLKYRSPLQASLDGNTVEMPVEQAAFAENNVRYQASLTFINTKIAEMNLALNGQ